MQLPERTPRNIGIAAGSAAGVIVLLLVIAQLALPGIAASKVAGDLEDIGPRPDVEVSAFPAVKLLFKKADKVEVDMKSATMTGSAGIAEQLEQADDVDELDVKIDRITFEIGMEGAAPQKLSVRDARLTKDGDAMSATATTTEADLQRQVPDVFPFKVQPEETDDGLVLGTIEAPIIGPVPVLLTTEGGSITAAPNLPIAAELFRLPVFSDPRVSVTSVGATKSGQNLDLSVTGTVR